MTGLFSCITEYSAELRIYYLEARTIEAALYVVDDVGANQVDDQKQIEAVLAGDREAFGPLMDRYYAMVYRVCFNMAGNAPDAGELAHDSFVEAYLKLGQLRDRGRFAGWLKTLTLNVCRMWYRRNQQRFVEFEDDQVAAAEDDPADRSIYLRMSHGLSTLSAPHRLVLILHYYEELSYDEIATFLEVSRGTVMSRLHRARHALKEVMEQMTEYQEIPAVPDDRFKEVVQAEIAVLLRMFHDEPNALERLTVVLRKLPERLLELIITAEDAVGNLAVLLPHLGSEAIDITLDCCFSGEEPGATNGRKLLERYASRCGTIGHRDGMPDMASRDAYLLLDRIIAHSADDQAKANILLAVMEACEHPCPAVLFMNALLSYSDAAFPILMERFESEEGRSPWVLQSLVRTGASFGKRLLEMMQTDDVKQQAAGLIGFEMIARSVCSPWLSSAGREQFLNDLRTREKWPPISTEDIGNDLIVEMTQRAAALVTDGPTELRSQAVRVLGYLKAGECSAMIRDCLKDADLTTRLAAIFALSEIGDSASADALIKIVQDGEGTERAAAMAALGRLQVGRAEHILVEMTRNKEEQVREAAVVALGEMGTVSSQVVLQELMRGSDPKLQKIAAKVIFGGVPQKKPVLSDLERRLAEKRRKVSPVAEISPDAAIRFGLTEMRSYDELEVTERIAGVCSDYCATRRFMVELGLMSRSNGIYEFTESGKSAWRVEQFICERYLGIQGTGKGDGG